MSFQKGHPIWSGVAEREPSCVRARQRAIVLIGTASEKSHDGVAQTPPLIRPSKSGPECEEFSIIQDVGMQGLGLRWARNHGHADVAPV